MVRARLYAFDNLPAGTVVDKLQTIIECLKFITTGELPPGAKTGGTWIHDPKVGEADSTLI